MTKLQNPFPDEPFSWNGFLVLFGPDAMRKKHDAAWARGYVDDEVADEIEREALELCAQYSGVTVEEVMSFLGEQTP